MKKMFAVALTAATVFPSVAMAKGNHPMAGCGLGYVLFANEDNSKIKQILGATTNGTSANQTFGITSGTSGCTEDGAVKFAKDAEEYADVNLDSLRREMAAGNGEFVTAFATLIGVPASRQPAVLAFFRENYTALFPTSDTTTTQFLLNLQQKMASRSDLLS